MSTSKRIRVRRKSAQTLPSTEETTPVLSRRPKTQTMSEPTPPPVEEGLDLSELEMDFSFSMDDVVAHTPIKRFRQGDTVQGTVCGVQADMVLVDIGAKSEAFLSTPTPNDFTLGDVVEAKISRMGSQGIYLIQRVHKSADLSAYDLAFTDQLPVEGTVLSANKGGFVISFGSIRGFCPISQIALGASTPEEHINQQYTFLISEMKSDEIIVSRRRLLDREREANRETRMAELSVGQELVGTVLSITTFGAFVDLDGVDGLIPQSKFNDIAEDISAGDELEVRIDSIHNGKIGLSAPSANPWLKMGTVFVRGGVYTGTVTKKRTFGIFVKLAPNLEGLLHNTRLSETESNELEEGQSVTVQVQDFDVDSKRIELQLSRADASVEEQAPSTLGDAFEDIFAALEQNIKPTKGRLTKHQR